MQSGKTNEKGIIIYPCGDIGDRETNMAYSYLQVIFSFKLSYNNEYTCIVFNVLFDNTCKFQNYALC